MPPHKAKARGAQQPQPPPQPSDYETDTPAPINVPLPPQRSNPELNLRVLRRHYPEVIAIRHVTPFASLYTFTLETQLWEKVDVDGTLFFCQLVPSPTGADRFSVVILNRRSLKNFDLEITSDEELEITEDYIILQGDQIYGIWVFSEPGASSTADARAEAVEKIQALAAQAAESRRVIEEESGDDASSSEQVPESVPMGRQLSLRELFGQQREQDAAWSVHDHHSVASSQATQRPPAMQNDVLGQLFMKAKQDYNGVG